VRIGMTLYIQRYSDWERYNEAEDTGKAAPIDPDADAKRYREEIDQALKAEDQGFDSIWTVEHHISPYTMIPNPVQLLTYFAGYSFTTPSPNNPFGNLGRNAFRTPGFEQWDLGIDKSFRITEAIRLQFRSEFFNVLNHTNFGPPTNTTTSGAFGTITNTLPARQIQFALKLLF